MLRIDSDNDKLEISLPIDLEEQREFDSNYDNISPNLFLEKTSNLNSSSATQGIKSYLEQLKALRVKYKQICQDLIIEENMNIQATT